MTAYHVPVRITRSTRLLPAGVGWWIAALSVGRAYPWWSLGIVFLCVYVVHGILVFGEDERTARTERVM